MTTQTPKSKGKAKKKLALDLDEIQVFKGSSNLFADLGFDKPDLELAKSHLVMGIARAIDDRGLSQKKAGELIGLPQPKVSQLLHGHWNSYSIDRLTKYLNMLGVTVRMTLEPATRQAEEGRLIGVQ